MDCLFKLLGSEEKLKQKMTLKQIYKSSKFFFLRSESFVQYSELGERRKLKKKGH